MIYYLSRLMRLNDKNMPKLKKCRANLWIHYGSLNERCDCKIWCKFPPTTMLALDRLENKNKNNNFNFK